MNKVPSFLNSSFYCYMEAESASASAISFGDLQSAVAEVYFRLTAFTFRLRASGRDLELGMRLGMDKGLLCCTWLFTGSHQSDARLVFARVEQRLVPYVVGLPKQLVLRAVKEPHLEASLSLLACFDSNPEDLASRLEPWLPVHQLRSLVLTYLPVLIDGGVCLEC